MSTSVGYSELMSPHGETVEELEQEWLRLLDLGAPQHELDAVAARVDLLERASA